MKKTIALGIVFLFVVMSFTSISGNQINNQNVKYSGRGDILYVGGSGEGNYSRIQDAIDDAVDGDIVFVFDDSSPYFESLTIGKSINLIGEDRDTTLIVGDNDWVVIIKADYVSISDFWIQAGDDYTEGISIISSFCTLSNNNIGPKFDDVGIYINNENNLIIDNKIFTDNETGITIGADNNSIINNSITNNQMGMYTQNNNIKVIGNTVSNNGYGIYLWGGSKYNISDNTIENNKDVGIYLREINNIAIDSNIISNSGQGITISPECTDIVISRNIISGHSIGVYLIHYGPFWTFVKLYMVSNTRIIRNDINNNTNGVWIDSYFNIIIENNFKDNERHALFLQCIINTWKGNYWGKPYDEPYRILGRIGLILPIWPFYNYDSTPAEEPYDINVNATQGGGIK